jgi:cobalamin biosynthesis protein CobW
LLGLAAAAENDLASRPSHHDAEPEHDHDDFDSFVIDLPPIDEPEALATRLAEVVRVHDVLRVKGFVEVAGKPMRLLVQGVGARIQHRFDRPWKASEARRGRLVIIGEKGIDRAAITALLAQA